MTPPRRQADTRSAALPDAAYMAINGEFYDTAPGGIEAATVLLPLSFPSDGEVDQREESGCGRQVLVDDLGAGQPGDIVDVVVGDTFARPPVAYDGDQGVMIANAALVIAIDRVDDGQWTSRLRYDTGLLFELAHRPLRDGLAEFEDAARKTPATRHRRVGAAHYKHAVAAHHHRQHPDDRPLRVAARLLTGS